MYTFVYVCIRLCTSVYVCVRLYTFAYVFIRIPRVHICMHVDVCMVMYVCMHVDVCMYGCMDVWICNVSMYASLRQQPYAFVVAHIMHLHTHAYHANTPMSIDSELHPLMCR